MPEQSEFARKVEIIIGGKDVVSTRIRPGDMKISQTLDGHHEFEVECFSLVSEESGATGGVSKELRGLYEHIGSDVEIKVGYAANTRGSRSENFQFKGAITSIESRFDFDRGVSVLLRGHSPTLLLDDVPKQRRFESVKVSDVLQTVASERGLSVTAESTQQVFDELIQRGQTDWEFLRRLHAQEGVLIYYDGIELKTAKSFHGSAVASLGGGEALFSFGLSMKAQPGTFSMSAWASKDKRPAEGKTTSKSSGTPGHPFGRLAAEASDRIYKVEGNVQPAYAPGNQSALDQDLSSLRKSFESSLVAGQGSSDAVALRPGAIVEISGVGEEQNGNYVITSVVHSFSGAELAYRNEFECAVADQYAVPRQPRVAHGSELWTGRVVDIDDPEGYGRVHVQYNHVSGELMSAWARVATIFGGENSGWVSIPEIDDEVLLGATDGDERYPVVVGSLYVPSVGSAALDEVKDAIADGNTKRVLLTPAGHKILFNDAAGEESIEIVTKGEECSLKLSAASGEVAITAKSTGKIEIAVDDACNVVAQGDVSVESEGSIEMVSTGDLKLESRGNVEIKAAMSLKLEGGMESEVKGGSGTVKAGPSGVDVQGPLIKLN